MQYISAKEAGKKWNISQRRVSTLCGENRIEGCSRVGNMWLIPIHTPKPIDARTLPKKKSLTKTAKPFVKWAGGKGQLIGEISKFYPKDLGNSIIKYVEPFIGGGAVLFDILSKYDLKEVHINDVNKDLINLYRTIKSDVQSLIELLTEYQNAYIPASADERKHLYSQKRELFNAIHLQNNEILLEKAALFIFLNKTCFNGLYRVNKKGLYNVPMGAYKNPCICDTENLLNVSRLLQKVEIHCGNYFELESTVDKNTFVYIDPPYRPLNATSSFTSYTEYCFDDKAQIQLAKFAETLQKKQASILLSNSDPKNSDENDNFFEEIYSSFTIHRVYATRMINSKSDARGKITELLIVG